MDKLLNDFSPGLFVVSTILLLALIALMVKFAWKPIMAALTEREEGIQNALDQAENARKEMQNLHADNERLLKEARAERDGMMKEAREKAATIMKGVKQRKEMSIAGKKSEKKERVELRDKKRELNQVSSELDTCRKHEDGLKAYQKTTY